MDDTSSTTKVASGTTTQDKFQDEDDLAAWILENVAQDLHSNGGTNCNNMIIMTKTITISIKSNPSLIWRKV